jgi:SMC interacting uncharacterized protein involved in chromosome segregation
MNSSPSTETSTLADLSDRLTEVQSISNEIDGLEEQIKALEKRRTHLESLCVEDLLTSKTERIGAAGRMWRVDWEHSMSSIEARKEDLIAAAEAYGIPPDAITQVNTQKLKSLIKEIAEKQGRDVREKWTAGTALEGLAGEYVAPRLRSVKAG